jgi:hypothetical protein
MPSDDQDSKYLLKKSQDLGINSMNLAELAIHSMKKEPLFLIHYVESCNTHDLQAFMSDLPSFFFDYTELKNFADFLSLYFGRKIEKDEARELRKHTVHMINKDFHAMFSSLIWESDSVSFCHGLLSDLIKDLKTLKKVTIDDKDSLFMKEVSYSENNSTFQVDRNVATGTATVKQAVGSRPVAIKNIKITTGVERNASISQYRNTLETHIREQLAHQQSSKHIVNAEILTEHIRRTFAEVRSQ